MAVTTEATEAPAIAVLRRTIDERWPQRSRIAERVVGRDGDHARGNAIDIAYDPVTGPDLERLAAALLQDPRTATVTWRGRIAEPAVEGGQWRTYSGGAEGSHAAHLHLSIDPHQRASQAPWLLDTTETGDVFWPFDSDRAKAVRKEQREYLRGTWVRDTPIGKFLRLDEPDEPAPAAPAGAPKPSPGWENYGHRRVDADTGASHLEQAGKEAATGASIGGTVGTALEAVPVVGPILHGAATVIGAIGGFFAGLGRDTFHPNALAAAAWLALFSLNPAMIFSDIDGIDEDDSAARAARLVRYFLLVSHTVPNRGPIYNPKSDRKDNPYMQRVDPRFPQTNPRHLRHIRRAVKAHKATPPEVTTPEAAQSLLSLIRKVLARSGVMKWDEAKDHRRALRRNLRHVRALAGETGRDVHLEALFGGNVSPKLSFPIPRAARRHSAPPRAAWELEEAGAPPSPLIIYGAAWCAPCHRAADYLRERGVPFVMKDIERTIGARTEMVTKLARAGLEPRAIPVLDVAGQIIVGFATTQLDAALVTANLLPPLVSPRFRTHEVTRAQAAAAKYVGTHQAAAEIARAWNAVDRDNWFGELMAANRDKARDRGGYWRYLVEGETVRIPDSWPRQPAMPQRRFILAEVRGAARAPEPDRADDFPTLGVAE